MTGIIHSFESLAAVDGRGLRFAVFLAGCPLRCVYCHNPDTWEKKGMEFTPEQLCGKVKRFKPYFAADGGVTFSGGEPLLQSGFLGECVPLLHKDEIPYVIDTSGQVSLTEEVRFVLTHSQEVLLDLKFWDDASCLKYTGRDMTKTMEILSFLNEIGKDTVIRTVVVPGINDSKEILSRYRLLTKDFSCIVKHELLPFHTMGFFKYENLEIKNPLEGVKALSREKLEELKKEF